MKLTKKEINIVLGNLMESDKMGINIFLHEKARLYQLRRSHGKSRKDMSKEINMCSNKIKLQKDRMDRIATLKQKLTKHYQEIK